MIKSILFLILATSALLVTCDDQQYALKYVTVLYDSGTAMPSKTFKNAKNPINPDWFRKCWTKLDSSNKQGGCITEEEAAKVDELTKRIQIKYSDFLPVYSKANKNKYKFVLPREFAVEYVVDVEFGGHRTVLYPSFESFYRHRQTIENIYHGEVDTPDDLPSKEEMEVDGECKKRDLLLSLADYATNTTKNEKFQKFLQEAGKLTGEKITAENYMEYISQALMEQISFPNKSHNVKSFLIDHNDAIMAHNRMLMGQLDDSIIQNGFELGKEIRNLRGAEFFYARNSEIGSASDCLKGITCRSLHAKIDFQSISSNTMAMNSMLIEFGLEKYITKAADYFPTSGKSINIELYQNTNNKNETFFKVVIFDPSDPQNYTDVTTDVKGCTGKDYCDFSVYDDMAMPYHPTKFNVDCKIEPKDASLYALPTTTITPAKK